MQAQAAVGVEILSGIEDVEARGPRQHGREQHPRRPPGRAGDGDPRANRGEGQGRAQVIVTQTGEALEQRIAAEKRENCRRQQQWPRVVIQRPKQRRSRHEGGGAPDQGAKDKGRGETPGGDGAPRGPRVGGVDTRVEQAVGGHGDRAGRHHAQHDQRQLPERGSTTGREKRRQQRKGQREHAVRELDVAGEGGEARDERRGWGEGGGHGSGGRTRGDK